MEDLLKKHRESARIIHNKVNCSYGDNFEYIYHLDMVVNYILKHSKIFKYDEDIQITAISGFYHDTYEDARLTFNDIKNATNYEVACVVLAVSDVPEENRLMKHLMTMGKTVKDFRAIILKMCDILANGTYSKENGSSMYKKYLIEYEYRRPIFKLALKWYTEFLNMNEVDKLWDELDMLFDFNKNK